MGVCVIKECEAESISMFIELVIMLEDRGINRLEHAYLICKECYGTNAKRDKLERIKTFLTKNGLD